MDYSIIIPIYNAEIYLDECLKSALAQEDVSLEVICIDDGSDDSSIDIINSYANDNDNVILLKQEHKGAGAARNNGLNHAKGKYVAFLDADDFYIEKQALKRLKDMCERTGHKICCSVMSVLEDGIISQKDLFENELDANEEHETVDFYLLQNDFYYQAYIFEKQFLIDNDIFFPDYKRYQDPPFLLKALHKARYFSYVPERLYCYRYGHQSSSIVIKNLSDVMRGLRDNVEIAIAGDYRKLMDRLVQRINYDFYEPILYNLSDDVISVVSDISKMVSDYDSSYKIEALSFLRDSYKNLNDSYSRNVKYQKIVGVLDGMLNAFLDNRLEDYFMRNNLSKIAIYGVGDYGKKLLKMLEKTHITVTALIDRNISEYNGCPVSKPDDPVPDCDCVVVSMMEYEEAVSFYQSKTELPVLALMEIIKELN